MTNGTKLTEVSKPKQNAAGDFCPPEDIDRVEDLFFVRERDGRTVERQLGIRRSRFELALRYAYNRQRGPNDPKPMQRASSLSLIRRTA